MLDMDDSESCSSSSMGSSKMFITQHSVVGLEEIQLPYLELTPQLIKEIFICPSLFLMNLSLCLLLKYSYHTGV